MVAYSFKQQFIEPIRAGTKAQTIRAPRRRHARPGEELQLYYAMRTRKCELIAKATCTAVKDIEIKWGHAGDRSHWISEITVDGERIEDLHIFAMQDGFASIWHMARFWEAEHGPKDFSGYLIEWEMKT